MSIDLKRFTKETTVMTAICGGWGKSLGRRIEANVQDGWYIVTFGNTATIERPARPAEVLKAFSENKDQHYRRCYSLGGDGIPINFANYFERNEGSSLRINFLNLEPFRIAKIVRQEDERWYSIGEDPIFQRRLLGDLRSAFEKETGIEGIRGITPELRYYFLLLSLQRQSFRAAEELEKMKLAKAERERLIKEFQATFVGRLQTTIEQADGELIRFHKKRANTYMVHWRVRGSSQIVKSEIRDDLKILDLGFCASGEDRKHWLDGAVQLAKMYGHLYITRD